MQIPYELKRRCVELSKTDTARHIYDTVFLPEHDGMGFETFRHKLRQWKKRTMADDDTLNAGTYAGFTGVNKRFQLFEWEPGVLAGIKYV